MNIYRKSNSPTRHKVVVFRALQLGDLMCAVPALRALRKGLPDAHITLVGLPWSNTFVRRFRHLLDDFIEFPGFPGLPEREPQLHLFPQFIRKIQGRRFDLALQIHGSGEITNRLVMLFGAQSTAGFYLPGQYCPDEGNFLPYPEEVPEIRRHLQLMEHLGFPSHGDCLEFPIMDADCRELDSLRRQYQFEPGGYAVVHSGARAVERRWPAERFAAAADGLCRLGFQVILTGSAEEQDLASEVAAHMTEPALNLAGKTSLGGVAALLREAGVLVSNDTGVSHLAAALSTPSVVLFSTSDPARWAPLNRCQHRILTGAQDRQPEEVLAVVSNLLEVECPYAV